MTVKVTTPNGSSDSVVFGSANTPTAAEVVGIDSGSSNGQLAFKTTASGTSTERMRIDTSGNVGIGTSSPVNLLTVQSSTSQNDSYGYIQSYYSGASVNGNAGFTAKNLSGTSQFMQWDVNGLRIGSRIKTGSGTGQVVFTYGNDTEGMRIDSSGNLLVNNTSTVYGKVTSQSSSSFDPLASSWATAGAALSTFGGYGGGLVMIDGSAGYALWVQDSGKDFYIRGNATGSSPTGGVYINDRATSWSAASDENVKDIIEPIENAVEKISTLRTVIGKYKDEEEGKRHPFLIAQDVQAVLPEAVSIMNKGEENECLGLSYTDTIPLLVAAIKEQQAIITDLKARIEALEAK